MAKPRGPHMPAEPRGFIILRFFQLIFGIILLGLSAYAKYYWGAISGAGPELTIFTAIATMITVIYILVATFGPQSIYNYWAILGLDIFLLIFWLISFALCAARAALFAGGNEYCDFYFCYSYSDTGIGTLGACAGLGALLFIFFIISTTVTAIFLFRHRKAGGHSSPNRMGGAVAPQAYEPHAGNAAKFEMQPQSTGYPVQNNGNMQQQYPPQHEQQYPPQQPYQQSQTPYQGQPVQQPMQAQPTGSTFSSPGSPPPPAQPFNQPTHYVPPAQYENGPQQLDSQQAQYSHHQ